MRKYYSIADLSWTEHRTNAEVLQMVEAERDIMNTVRSRQKRWIGHILRHDITGDNIRRTHPREEGLWRTKNSVLGLVTEDG